MMRTLRWRMTSGVLVLTAIIAAPNAVVAAYNFTILARTGENLSDGTPLVSIQASGGVALNNQGTAAFLGRIDSISGPTAALTQAGPVAIETGMLGDGSVVGAILVDGGVSLNDAGTVAFVGRLREAAGIDAVMTQNGVLAVDAGMLADNTPLTHIFALGTEGLNGSGTAAFGARIVPGISPLALVTQYQPAITQLDVLTDGSVVGLVLGGHSVNDAGKVAVVGRVGGGAGPDAVLTQDGVVAEVGQPLADGRTLGIILGGTSLNNLGDVLFIGRADMSFGPTALMTQHGVLVETNDVLPDSSVVGYISDTSVGSVLNDSGQAAFAGRLGSIAGPNALFTQDSLVVAVGGDLGGGFSFANFLSNADGQKGIAINEQGQIAFLASISDGTKNYSAVVLATPVPEPELCCAMLLALPLGSLSRRRGS
jgi:hypothetical protein